MPVSPHGDVTTLRSESALWARRAAIAQDAAIEVARAVEVIQGTFRTNYFGDCVEGIRFHDALSGSLLRLVADLTEQSDRALALGEQCIDAGDGINEADAQSANSIAT